MKNKHIRKCYSRIHFTIYLICSFYHKLLIDTDPNSMTIMNSAIKTHYYMQNLLY
jgi:hypothetical protein